MKKKIFCVIVLMFSLTITRTVLANSTNNAPIKPSFESAYTFYKNSVNEKDYEEFADAELKVKKLIIVEALPKIFEDKEWMKYPSVWRNIHKTSVIEKTKELAPEQKVYFFFSLKNDGKGIYFRSAIYDATTKELIGKSSGSWTKKQFNRKFEQK
ncbi:hypothetical protein [Bacillus sp. 1P06AnD]|uniref:hypothetical protein n=1 Tax=Bacillus sp. 1P06AnD TaxID=3132208 RepID=UPI0039A132D5